MLTDIDGTLVRSRSRSSRTCVEAELNGNSSADFATAMSDDGAVQVDLDNGSKNEKYLVGNFPVGVASDNLNHDEYPDLVTADQSGGTVTVLLNDGKGGFNESSVQYEVGNSPKAVLLGKYAGDDKHIDIVALTSGTTALSVLENDGFGRFSPISTPKSAAHRSGAGADAMAQGDINGDGHLDVAMAVGSGDSVNVLLGNGAGVFGTPSAFGAGDEPRSIVMADVDEDGHLDVVTANFLGTM